MIERLQSTEEYKGFVLEVWIFKYCVDDKRYRRYSKIYKNGKCLGLGKTKKEFKEMIDLNIYR